MDTTSDPGPIGGPAGTAAPEPTTILVIDDDAGILWATEKILRDAGFKVLLGMCATDALELTRRHLPSLVLLDVNLGDEDGSDVARQLKRDPELASVFVVLISGSRISSREMAKGLTEGQADGYIARPIGKQELLARIDSFLRIRSVQESLRESEAQKKAILNGITTNIALVDKELKILWANKASANSVNKRPEDMVGRHCYTFWGDPAAPCANCPAFKAIQTGQSEHKIVQTPDGRIWDEGGEPVFDRAGNVIAVVEIAQDITGRRQAEEALRALSSRQQALLTAIPDIIVEVDKNKVITWVNPVGLEFYGEDVLGKEAAFYFEGEQDTYSNIAPLFDGNEDVIYIESWQWRKDGKKRLLAWWCQVLKDAGGNVIGAISTARDITERKREEEALRETNAYLENLINYANAPIIVWDPQFRITRFNHAFEFLSGRTEAEVLGQSLELLFPPALREHSMALIRQTLSGQRWEVVEIKIQHQDGSERIVLWNSATLFAPEGQTPLATIAQGQDITDRKRAAAEREQLEAQNWQLQKSESLGRMAGAIAHHFNNQLQGVMGYLELAMNVLPKNAGHGKYMTGAMQSACKAAEMSTQMLTYLGQTIAKHEPLDFSDACRRSLSLLGAVMPQNVFLETNFSSPGPVICANSNQIQQLVTNLVTNAWEAMGEVRCVIRLTVETVSASDIPSAQHVPIDWQPQDSAYACLEVADAGCGIATQDIDKIFDPFFSSKFPGRGMGLAVVLGIVRAHHGVVTVESEPARGSVFRVFVPVLTAPLSCCAEGEHGQARTSTDKHGQTRTNTDEHG